MALELNAIAILAIHPRIRISENLVAAGTQVQRNYRSKASLLVVSAEVILGLLLSQSARAQSRKSVESFTDGVLMPCMYPHGGTDPFSTPWGTGIYSRSYEACVDGRVDGLIKIDLYNPSKKYVDLDTWIPFSTHQTRRGKLHGRSEFIAPAGTRNSCLAGGGMLHPTLRVSLCSQGQVLEFADGKVVKARLPWKSTWFGSTNANGYREDFYEDGILQRSEFQCKEFCHANQSSIEFYRNGDVRQGYRINVHADGRKSRSITEAAYAAKRQQGHTGQHRGNFQLFAELGYPNGASLHADVIFDPRVASCEQSFSLFRCAGLGIEAEAGVMGTKVGAGFGFQLRDSLGSGGIYAVQVDTSTLRGALPPSSTWRGAEFAITMFRPLMVVAYPMIYLGVMHLKSIDNSKARTLGSVGIIIPLAENIRFWRGAGVIDFEPIP